MNSENNNYYSEEDLERDLYGTTGDRAVDMGLYDDFEGAATGRRSRKVDGQTGRRSKKSRKSGGGDGTPPKKKWVKTLLIVLACLVALAGCGVFMAKQFIKDKFNQVNHIEVSGGDWDIDDQARKDLKDYKNILLLGVDTRENKESDDDMVRSDAMILVSINTKTNDVTMTSILRDSYLDLEEEGYHNIDKVTHAHAYGGPVNAVRAINRNLDLNVDDFIRVNWRTVAEITDMLGGLEVNVEEHELSELNKYIPNTANTLGMEYTLVENTGLQTLDGVQIATYCRIRKTDGDDARADRMREVITAAYSKAKTLKLSELNNVINKGMTMITTSMNSDAMLGMLLNMSAYDFGNKSDRWPYDWDSAMIGGVSYDVPVTLKSNVVKMHAELFEQAAYQPTERVLAISEEIKAEAGYYGGEEIDYSLLERYRELFGGLAGDQQTAETEGE